jgi:hypothetical protein
MGKKSGGGGAQMPSPSEYIPLVNAQAQANRVNTYTPYGSTVFRSPDVIPGTPANTQQNQAPRNFREAWAQRGNQGGKASQAAGGSAQSAPGVTPTESVTSFSPEVQRLFNQQVGMAGSNVVDPAVMNRQRSMALNPETFNQGVQDATFKRAMNLLEPGFQQQSRDFQQSMADRGLPSGGQAYDTEFANINRAQNSARENAALSAVLAGNDAALRERGQNFSELGQITNQNFAQRGQQFNELASILGQNQVAPTAPVDVMGPANMSLNRSMANQQNQQAKKSSGVNAGATLGSAALLSDRRLKENIVKISSLSNGLNVYEYNFKGKVEKEIGVMADEVELVMPHAVVTRPDGYKMVNYGMVLNG